jgi:CHAT domain-containing protein
LLIFPGYHQWLVFARWQGRVSVVTWPEDLLTINTTLRPDLLEPLAAMLAQAKQLSIVPYGAAQAIDFAELPFAGEPILARVDVVYRLGLGVAGTRTLVTGPSAVVGDPSGDLPEARHEALLVAQRLRTEPGSTLVGTDATRENVLRLLGRAEFFHYAGHGEAAPDRALRGLPLAGGNQLVASDILALTRVPARVVLAACDAGRSPLRASAGGWSLAHAFALAGANEIVAPVSAVSDADTAKLQAWLYEGLSETRDATLAAALARAQRRALALGMKNWTAFRAFAP